MQICKSNKQDKCSYKFNSLASNLLPHFYIQAFLPKILKILNFIRRVKRGRDCFFITFYHFPNTKVAHFIKFSRKKPSKFQTRFRDFYNITFRTKKCKFTDLFNNKFKF